MNNQQKTAKLMLSQQKRLERANEKIEQLQAENKRLRTAIEGALRISDLWALKEVETMFEDEAKALLLMKENFKQALKGGE